MPDGSERVVDEPQTEPSAEPQPARRRGRRSRARGQPNSSDAASARWTIRGVPPHVRDLALRASDGRGMTVGDWVAEAIVTTVRARPQSAAKLPATEAPPELADTLRRLDERLSRLEERQTSGFFGRLFGRRT